MISVADPFAAAAAAAAAKRKPEPAPEPEESDDEEEKEPPKPERDGYLPETFPDGSKFMGYFKANKRNGEGEFECAPDKSKYVGEWKDNQKHGPGTLTLQGGSQVRFAEIFSLWRDPLIE